MSSLAHCTQRMVYACLLLCASCELVRVCVRTRVCCSYTAKLVADDADTEKGVPLANMHEFFLHYVKMGLGVQQLQQQQMYAIAATTLQCYQSDARVHVFARWAGMIDTQSYSIFTSELVKTIIRAVIRPPTVCNALRAFCASTKHVALCVWLCRSRRSPDFGFHL